MGDQAAFRGPSRLRLLLDTHALLWAAEGRLAAKARAVIEHEADAVYVSAATVWEIEIKRAIGRLRAPEDLLVRIEESGFDSLAITLEHGRAAGRLPLIHTDPFDRMLVAQALSEELTLASADAALGRYGVRVLDIARR